MEFAEFVEKFVDLGATYIGPLINARRSPPFRLVALLLIIPLLFLLSFVFIIPSLVLLILLLTIQSLSPPPATTGHHRQLLVAQPRCAALRHSLLPILTALTVTSLPAIVVFVILPDQSGSNQTMVISVLSCYLTLLFTLQAVVLLLQIYLKSVKAPANDQSPAAAALDEPNNAAPLTCMQQFKQNHLPRILFAVAVACAAYESLQTITLPLQSAETAPRDSSTASVDWAPRVFQSIYLVFASNRVFVVYILALVVVMVMVLFFSLEVASEFAAVSQTEASERAQTYFSSMFGAIIYGHQTGVVDPLIKVGVEILSSALFSPVCIQLLRSLACQYPDSGRATLVDDGSLVCWSAGGAHQLRAFFALMALGTYVPFCILIAPVFSGRAALHAANQESYDVTWDVQFQKVLVLVKFFVLCLVTISFRGNVTAQLVSQCIFNAGLCALMVHWMRNKAWPLLCTKSYLGWWKAATFALGVLSPILWLVFVSQNVFYIVMGCAVTVVLVGVIVYWYKWRQNEISHDHPGFAL